MRVVLLLLAVVLIACAPAPSNTTDPIEVTLPGLPGEGEGEPAEGEGEGEGEPTEGEGEPAEGDGEGAPGLDGGALYATLCASCHGERGQGRTAPALSTWSASREELFAAIDGVMPLGAPETCEADCARAVTDYVYDHLRGLPADVCAGVDVHDDTILPPRGLRLLTRDEFRGAVLDVLRLRGGACDDDDDCADDSVGDVCGADARCAAPACGTTTFRFDPPGNGPGATRVHVAGSFNGWPPAHADGLALILDADTGVWSARTVLPPGRHEYKIVVDERDWLTDPQNTHTAPDGFGGFNSVLDVTCPAPADADFAAGLPPDLKPADFPFASHTASGVVGPVFVEEVLDAVAQAVARADVMALIPCDPASPSCATTFVQSFGRRAFRRPLTTTETARYRELLQSAPTFAEGATLVAAAMLSSPGFLYRSELGVPDGDGYRLDGFERATLLAFTLTGAPPDDALLDDAAAGVLDDDDGMLAVAAELLARPDARVAFQGFARHWLEAETVVSIDKNPSLFPGFTDDVRRDLAREAGLVFSTTMFAGRGVYDDLLTRREGFVSRRTASLYGVPAPAGDGLLPTTLPEARRGILSLAAVLAATSHSDQTSPIRRGLWVRNTLLCQPLPPPPPNAGGVPDVDPNATTRERFAQHTANAFCASCHVSIDPIGFGFEGFDAIGRERTTDGGHPVDDRGDMVDVEGIGIGTSAPFSDMATLADILAGSDAAERCFVTQVARYTLGDGLHGVRGCALRDAQDEFQRSGGDLVEGVLAVVRSPAFARRGPRSEP